MNSATDIGGASSLQAANRLVAIRQIVTGTILIGGRMSYKSVLRATQNGDGAHSTTGIGANIVAEFAVQPSTLRIQARYTKGQSANRVVMDGGRRTMEVEMKNCLFSIVLFAFLSGCSATGSVPAGRGTLLSFQDLANEITVGYEEAGVQVARQAPGPDPLGSP